LQANPATLFYPPAVKPPRANENVTVSMSRLDPAVRKARARTAHFRRGRAQSLRSYLQGQAVSALIARKGNVSKH
jgi:hypothetical protein